MTEGTKRVVQVSVDDMVATLRFMLMPAEKRVAMANKHVGDATPPAWLKEHVFTALHQHAMIQYMPRGSVRRQAGDMIARDDKGRIHIAVVTEKGRAWIGRLNNGERAVHPAAIAPRAQEDSSEEPLIAPDETWSCPEHGSEPELSEDGCCLTCGSDIVISKRS